MSLLKAIRDQAKIEKLLATRFMQVHIANPADETAYTLMQHCMRREEELNEIAIDLEQAGKS